MPVGSAQPDANKCFSHSSSAAGLNIDTVLSYELESLERRIERIEVAFVPLRKMGMWAIRIYRRLGNVLLQTPLAGVCQTLMGDIAPDEKYRRWLTLHRATDPFANPRGTIRIIKEFGPLISVVIPVYRGHLPWLKEAVNSVRAQSHQNWSLLIVFDGDPGGEVLSIGQSFAVEDRRIQCITSDHGGISSALNKGLNASLGAYTTFVDQDDVLEETALANVAAAISQDAPDILYTDEDYVDEQGHPHLPLFKPAWSPALLLSCMYFGISLSLIPNAPNQLVGFAPLTTVRRTTILCCD